MDYLEIRNKEALEALERSEKIFEEYKTRVGIFEKIHSIITKKKPKGSKKYNCLITTNGLLMLEGYILEFNDNEEARQYEHDVNELLDKAGINGSIKIQR